MQIRRIELENFRQFLHPVRIAGLGAGLNVIAGPNEEGKSTVLAAVRAAIFERFRSTAGEAFLPYRTQVDPRVTLAFSVGGVEYELTKTFSRKAAGGVRLAAGDGRVWDDVDAEEHLADLLRFGYPQRGASRAELQGPSGLLWVEQGKAFDQVAPDERSREALHGTLDMDVNEMLGGVHGQALFQRIEGLHEEMFDKRGKPRGEWKECLARLEKCDAELAAAREALAAFEGKVDALDGRRARLGDYEKEGTLRKAAHKHEAAGRERAALAEQRARVEHAGQAVKLAAADHRAAESDWKARSELVTQEADALQHARAAAEAFAAAEHALQLVEPRAGQARSAFEAARAALAAHEKRREQAAERGRLAQLVSERDTLARTLDSAEQADAQRRALQAAIETNPVDAKALARIEKLATERLRAADRLEALATRVEHDLLPGRVATLDGATLDGRGSMQVDRRSELVVPDVGTFVIRPGGEDLPALQTALEKAGDKLARALAALGMDDIETARNASRARETTSRDRDLAQERLAVLAPDGIPAVRDTLAAAAERCRVLEERLADVPAELPDAVAMADETRRLELALDGVEKALHEAERELVECGNTQAVARDKARTSAAEADDRRRTLQAQRAARSDDELRAAMLERSARKDSAERELAALHEALAAANPEQVELEAKRAADVYEGLRREIDGLRQEINDLEIELGALGQRDLATEVDALAAEHGYLRDRRDALTRRAQALDLLHGKLAEALAAARREVAKPIAARVGPYLARVLPGAAPVVGEDLVIHGIRRNDVDEDFARLSLGTREQVSVLARLAYADLLAGQGLPVCVFLDDALVNTDDARREGMKAVLYEAATRYQVIVLTCHEREYRDAGGTFIRLADCRA